MKQGFVAIEGNIGAGKTSLAQLLSKKLGTRLILEEFEDNSFLPKFYADPEKYAFPLEMSFLADRYQQLKVDLVSGNLFEQKVIADYIIDKSLVFARKTLDTDEYTLYQRLFSIIRASLPKPDLLIYLHNSVDGLLSNISKRGRSYEKSISPEYLQKIQDSYFDYFKSSPDLPILVVDTSKLDFVHHPDDLLLFFDVMEKEYSPGVTYYSPSN